MSYNQTVENGTTEGLEGARATMGPSSAKSNAIEDRAEWGLCIAKYRQLAPAVADLSTSRDAVF